MYLFTEKERQMIGDYYLSIVGEYKGKEILNELANTDPIWMEIPSISWFHKEIFSHYNLPLEKLGKHTPRNWEYVKANLLLVYIVIKVFDYEYFKTVIQNVTQRSKIKKGLRKKIAVEIKKDGSNVSHYVKQLSCLASYDKKLMDEFNAIEVKLYLKFNHEKGKTSRAEDCVPENNGAQACGVQSEKNQYARQTTN